MNKKFSFGKLPLLPRVRSSYRQFNRKFIPIICWVVSLFLLAGNASAVYTPANVADLIAAAKPVVPVSITPTVTANSTPSTNTSPMTAQDNPVKAVAALTSEITDRQTPEIKMEIVAAEYIPPAPKPVVRTSGDPAIGSGVFPFGQCTYYVATRRTVTWNGNAWQWFGNAQSQGYATGKTPKVGSIMVSWESSAGHVAYVESVNADGSFVVSEMNYSGSWGRVTSRTISVSDIPLIGFIY